MASASAGIFAIEALGLIDHSLDRVAKPKKPAAKKGAPEEGLVEGWQAILDYGYSLHHSGHLTL